MTRTRATLAALAVAAAIGALGAWAFNLNFFLTAALIVASIWINGWIAERFDDW